MPKRILIDEFHLTVVAPHGLPDSRYVTMHRTLSRPSFQRALRQAVRTIFRRYASLRPTHVRLSA